MLQSPPDVSDSAWPFRPRLSHASRTRARRHTTSADKSNDILVSGLCQMRPPGPVKHRDWRGHCEAHRCCGKPLMESALVHFGMRQHARPASISKRAPSTTRTSLRLESTICGGPEQCSAKPSFKSHCSAMRFAINGLATTVKSIVVKMCQTFDCRSITYGDLVQVVGGSTGRSATARAYGVNGTSEVITAYLVAPRSRKASSSP